MLKQPGGKARKKKDGVGGQSWFPGGVGVAERKQDKRRRIRGNGKAGSKPRGSVRVPTGRPLNVVKRSGGNPGGME